MLLRGVSYEKKQIRDPIYNYIELEQPFVDLINTPEFQRLRNIRQTSYEALYPSALHNRFVHSLGVFHLGEKAINYFEINIRDGLGNPFKGKSGNVLKPPFCMRVFFMMSGTHLFPIRAKCITRREYYLIRH